MEKTGKFGKPNNSTRVIRTFSEELKKKVVEQLDQKKMKVRDVMLLYNVSSQAVYMWKNKYSKQPKGVRMVVESESYETKVQNMFQRVAELEQVIGKKQLEIDFLETVINICSEELGYDIKKKYITMQSSGLERISRHTK